MVISNDTARPGLGIDKLIDPDCVSRIIISHIEANSVAQRKMLNRTLATELVPGGHACGADLRWQRRALRHSYSDRYWHGRRKGKRMILEDGKDYLLEPLCADVALIHAHEADHLFNLT